jgi:cell division septation protein DedD
MKNFSSNNKVINYYEQTKYVSAQDRDIDLEIQKERSELEASKAVLGDLDKKLSMRQGVSLKSQQINTLRDSLSTLNARLTMLEMNPQANQTEVRRVSKQIKSLENRAFEDIGQLYDMNNSKNGVPAKMLFDDWVNAFVGVDKSEARLTVLADIKRKYDRYYGQFAPLGSTMKRLEREIDVAEREYLEILHGLNQSKLREQNLLLSTNLKVLDAPKFPDKPEGSKRLLLIVGGFVVGLVLALVFVLLKEYLKNIFKNVTPTQVVVSTPKVSHSPEKRFVLNRKLGWVMASIAIVIAVAAMGIYAYQLPNETKNNQSVAKPTVAKATPPGTTWDTPSEPTEIQTNTPEIAKSETTFQPVVAQPQPTKTTETLYYVIAGSFKTKAAANQFKQELSQGGYSIQILEPEKEGETYKVAAGIFRNYKAAQDQAESIGFIMDIETTVFKKVI